MNQQPKTLASQWFRLLCILLGCLLIGFCLKNVGGSSGWMAVLYGFMAFVTAFNVFMDTRLVLLRVRQ